MLYQLQVKICSNKKKIEKATITIFVCQKSQVEASMAAAGAGFATNSGAAMNLKFVCSHEFQFFFDARDC